MVPGDLETQLDPAFEELLGSRAQLSDASSCAYGVWSDGRLAYLGPGWFAFARSNGGDQMLSAWGLGACIWDATPASLRPFYEEGFELCLREGRPWQHTYECSSPDLHRELMMITYPLAEGRGLLIVNSSCLEVPHPHATNTLELAAYVDDHGLIHQCMHCRRIQRRDGQGWDFVPRLVEHWQPNMTGSLCRPCFGHHYPGAELPPP